MKILVAEDDPISRRLLVVSLARWGYEVVECADGQEAWEQLQAEAPQLAILDWMMPELDGIELCRRVRSTPATRSIYILLLTAKGEKDDIVTGLEAGADDYLTKPFDRDELRARVRSAERMVDLHQNLADRVRELEEALAQVKQLEGIIPICCYCKRVRDDEKFWRRVEEYVSAHSGCDFSHGICPECWTSVVQPQMLEMWGEAPPYEEC